MELDPICALNWLNIGPGNDLLGLVLLRPFQLRVVEEDGLIDLCFLHEAVIRAHILNLSVTCVILYSILQ